MGTGRLQRDRREGVLPAVDVATPAAPKPVRGPARKRHDTTSGSAQAHHAPPPKRTSTYTDRQRLGAIGAARTVEATGKGLYSAEALTQAGAVLGTSAIDHQTLRSWINEFDIVVKQAVEQSIPKELSPVEAYRFGREYVMKKWESVEDIALTQLTDVEKAKSADYRSVGVVAGIARDKLDKMSGLPPELLQRLSRVSALCGSMDESCAWMDQLIAFISATKAQPVLSIDTTAQVEGIIDR